MAFANAPSVSEWLAIRKDQNKVKSKQINSVEWRIRFLLRRDASRLWGSPMSPIEASWVFFRKAVAILNASRGPESVPVAKPFWPGVPPQTDI